MDTDPCIVRCRIVGIPMAALHIICCSFSIAYSPGHVEFECWMMFWIIVIVLTTSAFCFSRSAFLSRTVLIANQILGEMMSLRLAFIVAEKFQCNFAFIFCMLVAFPILLHAVRYLVKVQMSVEFLLSEAAIYYCICFSLLIYWRDRIDILSITSADGPGNLLAVFWSILLTVAVSWAGGRYLTSRLRARGQDAGAAPTSLRAVVPCALDDHAPPDTYGNASTVKGHLLSKEAGRDPPDEEAPRNEAADHEALANEGAVPEDFIKMSTRAGIPAAARGDEWDAQRHLAASTAETSSLPVPYSGVPDLDDSDVPGVVPQIQASYAHTLTLPSGFTSIGNAAPTSHIVDDNLSEMSAFSSSLFLSKCESMSLASVVHVDREAQTDLTWNGRILFCNACAKPPRSRRGAFDGAWQMCPLREGVPKWMTFFVIKDLEFVDALGRFGQLQLRNGSLWLHNGTLSLLSSSMLQRTGSQQLTYVRANPAIFDPRRIGELQSENGNEHHQQMLPRSHTADRDVAIQVALQPSTFFCSCGLDAVSPFDGVWFRTHHVGKKDKSLRLLRMFDNIVVDAKARQYRSFQVHGKMMFADGGLTLLSERTMYFESPKCKVWFTRDINGHDRNAGVSQVVPSVSGPSSSTSFDSDRYPSFHDLTAGSASAFPDKEGASESDSDDDDDWQSILDEFEHIDYPQLE